jgi:hypothetical protein
MVTALVCMLLIDPSGGPGGLEAVAGGVLGMSTGFDPYRTGPYSRVAGSSYRAKNTLFLTSAHRMFTKIGSLDIY